MLFTCPSCGNEFQGPRPEAGQLLKCPACGQSFVDEDSTVLDREGPTVAGDLAPGRLIEGFLIEESVGKGAMGSVYKATQLSLKRTVALKVLPAAFAQRPAFVERFHEESMALSALNHPNIVSIIERGNIGDIYFLVMEYIDGPCLLTLMSEEPFDVEQFLKVATATAAALNYAHDRGVVHRDIKPSNIMLNSQRQVKIADFGLAGLVAQERKAVESGMRRPRRMGTPAYMSPEQKTDPIDVDGRSDIYSAGVVFYELLTGQKPASPLTELPSEVAPTADPRLDHIVGKCLCEDRGGRYQTAAELLEDLRQFEAELDRAPRCPECGTLSPVRFERCVHCGRDLEEFFDICPGCRQKNRHEVRYCLHCGTDVHKGRTLVLEKVSMMLDQADRLRLDGKFDQALKMLDDVQTTEGRAFEEHRVRAGVIRERTLNERRQAADRVYAEGQRMLRDRRFREALELFRSVPSDIRDTTEAVSATRQLQARLAADRRSRTATNLVLMVVAVILVVGGILIYKVLLQ